MPRFSSSGLWGFLAAVRFATLEIKLDVLVSALERRYRQDQPRAPTGMPEGGQRVEDRVRVAVGPRCDGFSSGCQLGGSFGTSGMYEISGKKLCRGCAVKFLGIQGLPYQEQRETLRGLDRTILK